MDGAEAGPWAPTLHALLGGRAPCGGSRVGSPPVPRPSRLLLAPGAHQGHPREGPRPPDALKGQREGGDRALSGGRGWTAKQRSSLGLGGLGGQRAQSPAKRPLGLRGSRGCRRPPLCPRRPLSCRTQETAAARRALPERQLDGTGPAPAFRRRALRSEDLGGATAIPRESHPAAVAPKALAWLWGRTQGAPLPDPPPASDKPH